MIMRSETLESGTVQTLARIGMGHADDEFRPLLKALSVEVDCTVFGNQPVDVVTGGHDTCTFSQDGSNLADTLVGG